MSTATLVATQYETAAELSESLGHAVRDIARAQLRLPGFEQLTPAQLNASRDVLEGILVSLQGAIDPQKADRGTPLEIPSALLNWLRGANRGGGITSETLQSLRSRMLFVPTKLDGDDFAVIDRLVVIIDAYTAHLYARIPSAGSAR